MTPTRNLAVLGACLSRGAWKAGTPGSEGAGTQQCVPATRRWRLQRHRKKGTNRHYVYTYPSKKALASVKDKVRNVCRQDTNLPLEVLLHRLNRVLRGWTAYFRFGVSHATFRYLRHFVWQRVIKWLRRKFRRSTWKELRRRNCGGRWWPVTDEVRLFDPARVKTVRYLYRGMKIPSPWPSTG
ncbi:MAG TPA: group II intron maturase-specific domain-containing protein [Thermobifida alba]|nr:group II intron maturase-specific domain-containing protein [Thermobifida alba]